jgi:vesicle-fusing ATPase
MSRLKAGKCPNEALTITNRIVLNTGDHAALRNERHVVVQLPSNQSLVFTVEAIEGMTRGFIGFSGIHRKWGGIDVNADLNVTPYKTNEFIASMVLDLDFYNKKKVTKDPFNTDEMAKEFLMQFASQTFTVGQPVLFQFRNMPLTIITVKDIDIADLNAIKMGKKETTKKGSTGVSLPDTTLIFEKGEGSPIMLSGKSKGKVVRQSIINPDWDFSKMGIGGLDTEFNAIFRRAFASRVFPPEIMEQLGCNHVKGILLFGPPGTGKTLMARQIGQMLNAREPKIVNGPQILDKYVGESEANIRRLFEDAEEEEKRMGPLSGLHIIIFDEIDAICKARGSVAGNSGVNDTVVNQLLSKIDGVDQLNNILIIGMTNRRDMIDDALLRPGRLEVSIEIGLPKEAGRVQIFNIHTRKMKANGKLSKDVDMNELARLTKNFSGAEIEGLVRAAQSCALNRLVKASSKVEIDPDAAEKLLVSWPDFLHAMENDIKPAFGASGEILQSFLSRGIIVWGTEVQDVLDDGALLIQQAASQDGPGLVSIMLEGGPNAGKTALAAQLANNSGFPFVKVCSPDDMVGFTESAKCSMIRKIFDDAYRSTLSVIVVDNVERLLDYGPIGPRYSNLTLQALLVLLKKNPPKGRRLLIICTTSRREVLDQMEMLSAFTDVLHVSNLTKAVQIGKILEQNDAFSAGEVRNIVAKLSNHNISIGVKKLLGLLDMIKQMGPQNRAIKFLSKLEEEGFATPT